jgi:hypothetical protein
MLEFASCVPITVLETAKFESICEGLAMSRCLDRGSLQDFYEKMQNAGKLKAWSRVGL